MFLRDVSYMMVRNMKLFSLVSLDLWWLGGASKVKNHVQNLLLKAKEFLSLVYLTAVEKSRTNNLSAITRTKKTMQELGNNNRSPENNRHTDTFFFWILCGKLASVLHTGGLVVIVIIITCFPFATSRIKYNFEKVLQTSLIS